MEKMRFEQFAEEVVGKIREFLPESFAHASVELQTVTKNNDLKLTGLTIRSGDSNICPTIYLEAFYDEYQAGKDMGKILSNIADARIRHEVSDTFDVTQITDFEKVRSCIVPRIIGMKWNTELLKGRPYKQVGDLAVTYHIMLKQDESETASSPITNNLLEYWEVDIDMLHDLAIMNMQELLPGQFQTMGSVLGSLLESDDEIMDMVMMDQRMFIITNDKKSNGAAAILDEKLMQSIIEKIGEDFYLLPSSVHEWILIKATDDVDVSALNIMVNEVNESQVAPDERLSDHAYRYTLKEGLVTA